MHPCLPLQSNSLIHIPHCNSLSSLSTHLRVSCLYVTGCSYKRQWYAARRTVSYYCLLSLCSMPGLHRAWGLLEADGIRAGDEWEERSGGWYGGKKRWQEAVMWAEGKKKRNKTGKLQFLITQWVVTPKPTANLKRNLKCEIRWMALGREMALS